MKSILRILILTLTFILICHCKKEEEPLDIPDYCFRRALIYKKVDANMDGIVTRSDAEAVTSLDIDNFYIVDLTGIEAFINLKTLSCNNNKLTRLDISNNIFLTNLECDENELSNLDVSKNTKLESLSFNVNHLTSIDLSNNPKLISLSCYRNQLTSLDLSNNFGMKLLSIGINHLTTINLANNFVLEELYCFQETSLLI